MLYNSWDKDMALTQPCIESIKSNIFKGCHVANLEQSTDETLLMLDQYSGIDYIIKKPDNNMLGVAARIQWGNNWETFTIRKSRHTGTKTEYEKRKDAIKQGYFYPALTMQAYFTKDIKHLGSAIIKTKKLYDFIDWNPEKVHQRKSDNIFIYVNWGDLIDYGIVIYEGDGFITHKAPLPKQVEFNL